MNMLIVYHQTCQVKQLLLSFEAFWRGGGDYTIARPLKSDWLSLLRSSISDWSSELPITADVLSSGCGGATAHLSCCVARLDGGTLLTVRGNHHTRLLPRARTNARTHAAPASVKSGPRMWTFWMSGEEELVAGSARLFVFLFLFYFKFSSSRLPPSSHVTLINLRHVDSQQD